MFFKATYRILGTKYDADLSPMRILCSGDAGFLGTGCGATSNIKSEELEQFAGVHFGPDTVF